MQTPTEPGCSTSTQEADAGESELEGLETVLDSCFMPALEHMDRGTGTVEALDALVVDLLSLAQSSSREREKAFAVEALESLQRQCPMSMAVTLRHYSEVYQAAQAGAAPLAKALEHICQVALSSMKQAIMDRQNQAKTSTANSHLYLGDSPADHIEMLLLSAFSYPHVAWPHQAYGSIRLQEAQHKNRRAGRHAHVMQHPLLLRQHTDTHVKPDQIMLHLFQPPG